MATARCGRVMTNDVRSLWSAKWLSIPGRPGVTAAPPMRMSMEQVSNAAITPGPAQHVVFLCMPSPENGQVYTVMHPTPGCWLSGHRRPVRGRTTDLPPSDPRKGVGSGLLDDGAGRTLVDACAAVDAFVLENHGYVLDEDRILRAHIRARTACDAFACFHGRHMLHLREHTWRADIMVRFERRSPDETAPWGSQRLTVAMPSSGT